SADGKAQAVATRAPAASGINPVEPFEDPRQMHRGNANSRVDDEDSRLVVLALDADVNLPARRCELDRVVHQAGYKPAQLRSIPKNLTMGTCLDDQFLPRFGREDLKVIGKLAD